jgi:hypothetical protein
MATSYKEPPRRAMPGPMLRQALEAAQEMGWTPGEHLPQEMLGRTAAMAKNFVMRPEEIAEAVLYALCVPDNVQVSEIMIRPLQPLQMPGMRLPA